MSKIRILSEHLANQIAAGEVVERPASVVKELVENSLDAGADRIAVQVEGSGVRLIRVIDNGEGMDADDVLLSLERHATSKLRDGSVLEGITTLGFRGEALPSIASVARLTLWSRPADRKTGTKAEIRYGVLQAVQEAGCASGTIVEVRHLFGNVPARRKFLKSGRTELHHIGEVLRNQSLAHVRTAFSLEAEGRTVVNLAAREELEDRVRDLYPERDIWLRIGPETSGGADFRLEGFLLHPGAAAAGSDRLRILVNARPIQDRVVRHAVTEALRGFLMQGRSPAGVVLLMVPPEMIDVNVHPAKLEIRFRQAGEVHRFVMQVVAAALGRYQETVRTGLFSVPPAGDEARRPPSSPDPAFPVAPRPLAVPLPSNWRGAETAEPVPVPAAGPGRDRSLAAERPREGEAQTFSGLTLIGVLFNLYLLCEKEGELVVIDQHAAHERILYQQLQEGYLQRCMARQSLLFPLSLELTPRLSEAMAAHRNDLETLGFSIEHFGDETWVVKAIPALVGSVDPRELVVETVELLAQGGGGVAAQVDRLLATMACKAAVKAGNRLAPRELLELLVRMREAEIFSHCPHGRPVFRRFSGPEIARWFGRT